MFRQQSVFLPRKKNSMKRSKKIIGLGSLLVVAAVVAAILLSRGCEKTPSADNPQGAGGTTVGTSSPALTQPTNPTTQELVKSIWVAEFYVIPSADGKLYPSIPNKGLWWRFNIDGTYVGGQWDKEFDHGSWFWKAGVGEYDKFGLLYIDSATDDMRDVEFQVQGISDNGTVMSWVKTENSGTREPGMLKMIPLMTMPTKRQFGLPE